MERLPSRAALIALGVIAIVLGAFVLLAGASTFFGMVAGWRIAASAGHLDRPPLALLLLPLAFQLFSAGSLIWLGIGTVLARRWARALMVALSWLYLCADVLLVAAMAVGISRGGGPHGGEWIVLGFVGGLFALFAIGLPVVFISLFSRKKIIAVFEAYSPRPSFTDRCPPPVLALAVLLVGAATVSVLLAGAGLELPIAGQLWTGTAARAGYLIAAAMLGSLGVGAYHLRRSAWWATLLCVPAALGSAYVSLRPTGESATGDAALLIATVMIGVASSGYLLWVRRRFTA